eukprot:gb/GECG01004058.1/.p1 GENE.gb/GECG01004058.1/~~gb/GECG01004058.1/.p1  ORF type:complete len:114 (+),score=4.44 gb/GECG01004058.1/:1-342(+)
MVVCGKVERPRCLTSYCLFSAATSAGLYFFTVWRSIHSARWTAALVLHTKEGSVKVTKKVSCSSSLRHAYFFVLMALSTSSSSRLFRARIFGGSIAIQILSIPQRETKQTNNK